MLKALEFFGTMSLMVLGVPLIMLAFFWIVNKLSKIMDE